MPTRPPRFGDKAAVIAQIAAVVRQVVVAMRHHLRVRRRDHHAAEQRHQRSHRTAPQPDGVSVVGWGAIDPSLGAWTYAWYAQNGNDRVIFDADVTLQHDQRRRRSPTSTA